MAGMKIGRRIQEILEWQGFPGQRTSRKEAGGGPAAASVPVCHHTHCGPGGRTHTGACLLARGSVGRGLGNPAGVTAQTCRVCPSASLSRHPKPVSYLGSPCHVIFQQNQAWHPSRAWEGRQAPWEFSAG